ncbi:LOB domain-containing protein 31-like [Lycium ferocissimum]|uniref:LOB domain-containing protein 31-like n=1 Tax=Lycium ferocissimum TaxID=112874 RepID=UPI002815C930|nr:LOB domain-containing protein 31-like [Lycium ferocissimum]
MSSGGGPCGACKFLRRKCVRDCIFAPYFDSEQGMSHFAAVHKVFGASNASKLLLTIPPNKRLETVITLCYEALARVRDPVYGCVGHIFSLQQQAVTLQAELAYVQARISTLQHSLPMPPTPSLAEVGACCSNISSSVCTMDPLIDVTGLCDVLDQQLDNCDLHTVAVDFVSRH